MFFFCWHILSSTLTACWPNLPIVIMCSVKYLHKYLWVNPLCQATPTFLPSRFWQLSAITLPLLFCESVISIATEIVTMSPTNGTGLQKGHTPDILRNGGVSHQCYLYDLSMWCTIRLSHDTSSGFSSLVCIFLFHNDLYDAFNPFSHYWTWHFQNYDLIEHVIFFHV